MKLLFDPVSTYFHYKLDIEGFKRPLFSIIFLLLIVTISFGQDQQFNCQRIFIFIRNLKWALATIHG